MRPIVLLLVSILLLPSHALGGNVFDDLSSLEKDAYVHFSAGVLISHTSYPFFKKHLRDNKKAMWRSLLLTAILSTAKELYDRDKTGFNTTDLAAGILGGCTILVVSF
ncbi:MAG: hypothetical protein A2293_14565 [Elusimicrobia bacterium RIFOXYB2_FULL_49_7]|nr:MAG: hypothetical protein A2293_14565 [Elusimicrobia bacterium RIFOXYB2_FULL_49_7]